MDVDIGVAVFTDVRLNKTKGLDTLADYIKRLFDNFLANLSHTLFVQIQDNLVASWDLSYEVGSEIVDQTDCNNRDVFLVYKCQAQGIKVGSFSLEPSHQGFPFFVGKLLRVLTIFTGKLIDYGVNYRIPNSQQVVTDGLFVVNGVAQFETALEVQTQAHTLLEWVPFGQGVCRQQRWQDVQNRQ
ncbi:MAG: hypothetical protein BWX66_01872 [Deltaproteobacteria bacterium ADurb.Bin058]|nr:MAG: hypothetical protein BWX66_01872 [Deltaproteobacteria bacterium ADurb.Bin058]